MPASIQLTGLRETQAKLIELGAKTAKKFVRVGLRKGAGIIQKDARANAHRISGLFARSIKVVNGRTKNGVMKTRVLIQTKAYAGAVNSAGNPKGAYGIDEELGHYTGRRISKGASAKLVRGRSGKGDFGASVREEYARASASAGRKFIPGAHVIQHAYDRRREEAAQAVADKIASQITEEAAK